MSDFLRKLDAKLTKQYTGPGIYPVRALGSGRVHLAMLTDEDIKDLVSFGVPCQGNYFTAEMLCLTRISKWIVMQADTKIGCTLCRRVAKTANG